MQYLNNPKLKKAEALTKRMFSNDWLLCEKWFTLSYVIDSWHSKLILWSLIKSSDITLLRTATSAHRHPVASLFVSHLHHVVSYRFTTCILKAHHYNRHNSVQNQSSFCLSVCWTMRVYWSDWKTNPARCLSVKVYDRGKVDAKYLPSSRECVQDQGQAGQRQRHLSAWPNSRCLVKPKERYRAHLP